MDLNAKTRIMSAAKFLLAQKSIDKISTREIAELAKVDSAAIGYYFRSKSLLLTEALDSLII